MDVKTTDKTPFKGGRKEKYACPVLHTMSLIENKATVERHRQNTTPGGIHLQVLINAQP